MVRETRFSFDDGMNVDFPRPRDTFDDDELDELAAEDDVPFRDLRPYCQEKPRNQPHDRRTDRRHLAGADWMSPAAPRKGEEGVVDGAKDTRADGN